MSTPRGKRDPQLEPLYRALQEDDYPTVLQLGQALLTKAHDKLAVVDAMIDALENLLYGGVEDPAPLKLLERSLREEKHRLVESGAKSDVYKEFLDPSPKDD
ncbi:MAG: hypothetical protein IPJ65_05965 [Archangiaceae bacterium]|nr:hypothetical protein [Archangiaceae bacterium]